MIERKKNWELTEKDRLRVDLLKTALEMVLVKAGVVSKGMKPTAPELLTAANSYVQSITPKGDDEGLAENPYDYVSQCGFYSAFKYGCKAQQALTRQERKTEQQLALEIAEQQGYEAGLETGRQERLPDRKKIACQLCGLNKTCEEPRHKPILNNKPAGMVCEYNLEKADQILALFDGKGE